MTDKMHRLAGHVAVIRRGGATVADQALASATNFLASVIIGRACSKEELGFYMLGFTIMLVPAGVQQALILSPFIVFSAQSDGVELRRYTGTSLICQMCLCLLATICLVAAATILAVIPGLGRLAAIVWALSAAIPLILLREFARQMSFARLKVSAALLVDSSVFVLHIGGLLLLAHFGLLSARRAYWMLGVVCGTVGIAWLVVSRRDFAFHRAAVLPSLTRNWRVARWLFAATLARTGSAQMYPWVLAAFHGVAATGVLAACRGILFAANPFLIGLQNFLVPKSAHEFHHNGPDGLRRTVSRAMLGIAAVMSVFCLAMLLFGGVVLRAAYGSKYAGYGLVIGVLALVQLVSAINAPLTAGLLAMERSDVEFKSYLVAVLVMFTMGIWLVRAYGPLGVACGLLIGNTASLTSNWLVFQRQRRPTRATVGILDGAR